MIKLSDKELASMIIELAKTNEDSNNDIQNIELLNSNDIDIFIYSNHYYNDFIVCIYSDYLYNNKDVFCAELYFNVQYETITHHVDDRYIKTDRIVATYLHAINQH